MNASYPTQQETAAIPQESAAAGVPRATTASDKSRSGRKDLMRPAANDAITANAFTTSNAVGSVNPIHAAVYAATGLDGLEKIDSALWQEQPALLGNEFIPESQEPLTQGINNGILIGTGYPAVLLVSGPNQRLVEYEVAVEVLKRALHARDDVRADESQEPPAKIIWGRVRPRPNANTETGPSARPSRNAAAPGKKRVSLKEDVLAIQEAQDLIKPARGPRSRQRRGNK